MFENKKSNWIKLGIITVIISVIRTIQIAPAELEHYKSNSLWYILGIIMMSISIQNIIPVLCTIFVFGALINEISKNKEGYWKPGPLKMFITFIFFSVTPIYVYYIFPLPLFFALGMDALVINITHFALEKSLYGFITQITLAIFVSYSMAHLVVSSKSNRLTTFFLYLMIYLGIFIITAWLFTLNEAPSLFPF